MEVCASLLASAHVPLSPAVETNTVTIQNQPHQGWRAADFVGRTQGKLRDFYRIGKVLGTGKRSPIAWSGVTDFGLFRRFWRGAHVRAQRVRCPARCEGLAQEPHGRRREAHAVQRDQYSKGNRKCETKRSQRINYKPASDTPA